MKKIVILTWWTSSEKEIALKSAETFREFLKKDFDYYVLPEELDKFLENREKYDLAIPVFHWVYWEDWMIFAFLKTLWIKSVFSSFETQALCLNKFRTNEIVKTLGVKVPKQFLYNWELEINSFPLIVKPNRWWSSLFTYRVENEKDFDEKIKFIKENVNDFILVQEFITWEEYSVSIVAWEVLPIMKLEKQNLWDLFDFENKYLEKPKIIETWPEIEKNLKSDLETKALEIYKFLWCRGFSRVDFLVKDNEIYFLEVNTIPWMTKVSIVPKSWLLTWRTLENLIETIINDK